MLAMFGKRPERDARFRMAEITTSTTSEQILEILSMMSIGVTPAGLMESVARLPSNDNTKYIGAFAVGASMSVRKVIKDVVPKSKLTMPDDFKIAADINYTKFALLGHILFLIEDSKLTKGGLEAKKRYQHSIHEYRDITHFGVNGVIPGKPERTTIVQKYAGMLAGFDVKLYTSMLSSKFPGIVKPTGFSGMVPNLGIISTLTFPIRMALSLFSYAFQSLFAVFGRLIYFEVAAAVFIAVVAAALIYVPKHFSEAVMADLGFLGSRAVPVSLVEVPGFTLSTWTSANAAFPAAGMSAYAAFPPMGEVTTYMSKASEGAKALFESQEARTQAYDALVLATLSSYDRVRAFASSLETWIRLKDYFSPTGEAIIVDEVGVASTPVGPGLANASSKAGPEPVRTAEPAQGATSKPASSTGPSSAAEKDEPLKPARPAAAAQRA